ncbi:MAG: hypothetical protein ACHP9Z_02210 [Streptosporangiales bacterium]
MIRRGGPYPHLRLDLTVKVEQGSHVFWLVHAGHSFREISAITGWSLTTC